MSTYNLFRGVININNLIKKFIDKNVITTKDVTCITGLSRAAVCSKARTGRFKYIKKSKQGILFDKDDFLPNINKTTGKKIKKFFNNEYDIVELLISGYKIILSGRIGTGKTTILNIIRQQTEEYHPEFKLFDYDEIPKDFLKIHGSSLAVVQADNEVDAFKCLSEHLDVSIEEIKSGVDFICTIESRQITILKADEII